MATIGPIELIIILLIFFLLPTVIFIIGFYFGKKSGYLKREKEENVNKKF